MTEFQIPLAPDVVLGDGMPVIFAGPCAIEDEQMAQSIAARLREITTELGLPFVFKASYDKANRTSRQSYRSLGLVDGLEVLDRIRREEGVPVISDVHQSTEVAAAGEVLDVIQIPAFLCRQTDLLEAAGATGKPINIKRGQFMSPENMAHSLEKVTAPAGSRGFLTERGYSFGYGDLVVDMRALPIMRQFAPVVYDVTHSIQRPGTLDGRSGGAREFAPYLARAAAGAGVDGFFLETHPSPDDALSDGPNMIPLDEMPALLRSLLEVWKANQPYVGRL